MLTRRRFLQGTALAAGCARDRIPTGRPHGWGAVEALAPDAFIRIAPDNTITIISKHIEFGQGTYSGLATILAEELDADWSQVRVEAAPADAQRYGNRLVGGMQMTGGSTAMAAAWDQLRRAGATARAMLVEAAAREWGVPASAITVDGGVISHPPSGRRATFGELASKAAALTPPAQVTLKDPKDFKLIGKRVPRVDSKAKTDGSAQFTADFAAPGPAHRADRAAAALRGHREVRRRDRGAAREGRDPRGAGAVRRRRRRHRLLGGAPGTRGAAGDVGRKPRGTAWHRRAVCGVPHARRAPGEASQACRRRGRRAARCDEDHRSRLRVSVPRARADGAARRRRAHRCRRGRPVGGVAGAHVGSAGRRPHRRRAGRPGPRAHAARGRQLRAARDAG